jgi:hypothetical protein
MSIEEPLHYKQAKKISDSKYNSKPNMNKHGSNFRFSHES